MSANNTSISPPEGVTILENGFWWTCPGLLTPFEAILQESVLDNYRQLRTLQAEIDEQRVIINQLVERIAASETAGAYAAQQKRKRMAATRSKSCKAPEA